MKRKSKEVFAHTCSLTGCGSGLQGWDYAIHEAQLLIASAHEKIDRLTHSIRVFEEMRDAGEPWPGTSESESGLLGQEGDLGQSPAMRLCTESRVLRRLLVRTI